MKLDFLDIDELQRITCRKTAKAMARRLDVMELPYLLDGDGWPLVLRSNIDKHFVPAQDADPESETNKQFQTNIAHAFDHLKQQSNAETAQK